MHQPVNSKPPCVPYSWSLNSVIVDVPGHASLSACFPTTFERTSSFSRSVSSSSTDTFSVLSTSQSSTVFLEHASLYSPIAKSIYGEVDYAADSDAAADAELEAELLALLGTVPQTPQKKKTRGSRRPAVISGPRSCKAPKKPRSVSASAVFSAMAHASPESLLFSGYEGIPSRLGKHNVWLNISFNCSCSSRYLPNSHTSFAFHVFRARLYDSCSPKTSQESC